MSVYVDEIQRFPTKFRAFKSGSAHLTADTVEELHRAAQALGLHRNWFQDTRIPHYDLAPSKRAQALLRGLAVFVPAKEQARRRIRAREVGCAMPQGPTPPEREELAGELASVIMNRYAKLQLPPELAEQHSAAVRACYLAIFSEPGSEQSGADDG